MSEILRGIRQRKSFSVKLQMLFAAMAVAAAVALPQLVHLIGRISGTGTSLGVALLPMHLPILFVGLLAGPVAGGLAGALAPLASFALSGMPVLGNLPLMVAEVAIYGLVAGLLREVKLPSIAKLLVAQLAGRVVYVLAVVLAVYAAGRSDLGVITALQSFKAGLFGLVLQWTLLPLLMCVLEQKAGKSE